METNYSEDDILFVITRENVQWEAKRKLGCELTEDEIEVAKKGLSWGLLTGIDSVYGAIFEDFHTI